MPKVAKSAAELVDMLMVELRKHPECNAITRIKIIRPVTRNWDVTIAQSRPRPCPPECYKILVAATQRLRALYDLMEEKR